MSFYIETKNAYCNCEKRIFPGVGEYDMPEIRPVDVDLEGCTAIGFNYAIGCRHPEDKVLHFHVDDYQFVRVWNDPKRYLPMLRRFRAVLAPDFSAYEDFPKAVRIFNAYRKAWCAAYWQENGVTVIPTLDWDTELEHDHSFDGIPRNALVSVSTIGGFKSKARKADWLEGFRIAMRELSPSKLLVFGKLWPEVQEAFGGEIILMENSNLVRKSTLSKKPEKEVQHAENSDG